MAVKNRAAPHETFFEKTTGKATKLTVKYDCGFDNFLTVRGSGAGLSWERGAPLKNVTSNSWIFETKLPFTQCEYKILINDTIYEEGPNHLLVQGKESECTPHF